MASREMAVLDIRLQNAWISAVKSWNNKNGLTPFLTCTYRSPEEQNSDYAKGRTVLNPPATHDHPLGHIVTNAKAFQSPHNFTPAQAFDFAFEKMVNGKWVAVWDEEESYAEFRKIILLADNTLISGAAFKGIVDADHIETPDWRTMKIKTA